MAQANIKTIKRAFDFKYCTSKIAYLTRKLFWYFLFLYELCNMLTLNIFLVFFCLLNFGCEITGIDINVLSGVITIVGIASRASIDLIW